MPAVIIRTDGTREGTRVLAKHPFHPGSIELTSVLAVVLADNFPPSDQIGGIHTAWLRVEVDWCGCEPQVLAASPEALENEPVSA